MSAEKLILADNTNLNRLLKNLPDDPEHLENGGSQFSKRLYCSGSLEMELTHPQKSAGADAAKGTVIHNCIEFLTPKAIEKFGSDDVFKGIRFPKEYKPDEIEAAKDATLNIFEALDNILPNCSYEAERKVIVSMDQRRGGTVDGLASWRKGKKNYCFIWDFKNGRVPVSAVKSDRFSATPQPVEYAIGIQNEMGWIYDEVWLCIYQPNNYDTGFTKRVLSKSELKDLADIHHKAAEKAMGRDGPRELVAGEHCMFCSAKTHCEAFDIHLTNEACLSMADDDLPDVGPPPQSLTDDQVLRAYKQIPLVKRFIKDLEGFIKARGVAGDPVQGTEVVYGSARRKWDEAKTIATMNKNLKALGISDCTSKKLIGIGEVETKLKAQGMTAKEAKAKLIPFTTKGEPPVSIVMKDEIGDRKPARLTDSHDEMADFDASILDG